MIRKRKSKIAENEPVEENVEKELMGDSCFLGKKDSAMKSMEEVFDNGVRFKEVECQDIKHNAGRKSENKPHSISSTYTLNSDMKNDAYVKSYDEMERGKSSQMERGKKEGNGCSNEDIYNQDTTIHQNSVQRNRIHISENESKGIYQNGETKRNSIDELCAKYDKEVQKVLDNFEFLTFSRLFKNPFDSTISRDEKIVRIFYYSGFSFLPYIGWVVASIFGSFCKEKNNKNIVSLRIISSIQCAFFGLIIILLLALYNINNRSILQCKYDGISFKKKMVKDAKYNVVFFGPMSTDDWMKTRLAKIAEDLQFNVYVISYPNLKNRTIQRRQHVFLKDALACARLKYAYVILFSFQLESALNFTIPFLENEVLGFLSFSKKFPKKVPTVERREKENIIYFAPVEKNLYDIYSSITLRMCQNEKQKYYNILHIVHHSFNKYRIRCSKNLAQDYSIIVNNFNFNTIGVEEKGSKYEDDDFREVIDDFYQYLIFIRDIISQKNLEFYRKILCKNTLCEEKGSVCVL
ncbi:conserved Plasmodium protein, unknown function [Plasmodium ovale]|uniref:Uncharacterized protein n=1 Tax=Plasmodium ovale TaxID=36330 RepID=A0A1D3TKZ6_PLAOA|nr:conserved Plasmodium protein, unknown function [Plasmodium ovale]